MQLNDLFPAPGSRTSRKRVGRGNGSGHGSTAGRGDKGQNSRSGGGKGPGFEGGQNPLHMRMPKLGGFKNRNRVEYAVINVDRIQEIYAAGETVDVDTLFAKGVIKSKTTPVKVLGDGDITVAVTVRVDKASASARAKIEAAGGTVDIS